MIESLSQDLDFSLKTKIKNGSNFFIMYNKHIALTKQISENDLKFILLFFNNYLNTRFIKNHFVKFVNEYSMFNAFENEDLSSLENFAILNCHSDDKLNSEFSRSILKLKENSEFHIIELNHVDYMDGSEGISFQIKTYNKKMKWFGKISQGTKFYSSKNLFGNVKHVRHELFAAYFENLLIK